MMMTHSQADRLDFKRPESVLDLANIRSALIRMEDTILYDLIERAQFTQMPSVYKPGVFPHLEGTFLDWILRETESTHAKLRRYDAADENAFFPVPTERILPALKLEQVLAPYQKEVNVNDRIKQYYIENIVPGLSSDPSDEEQNFGSCSLSDVWALQAISRRIHFGKFVAESKFRSERELFTKLITEKDIKGIEAAITKPEVELQILERIRHKADTYGADPQTILRWSEKGSGKVDPEVIVSIYRDLIIPLTKDVEVDYLLRRLETEN